MIDLEKGEIDSETETEVDFTHFRSIESLWIIIRIDLEKENTHLETEKWITLSFLKQSLQIILDQFSRKEREDDSAHFRLRSLFGSLSTIDLKEEEIAVERESEVDFTHFQSRRLFRSSSATDLEKKKRWT